MSEVPAVIAAYQAAHDSKDVQGALTAFAEGALVHDDGRDWIGAEQIREWLSHTSSTYTYTRELLDAAKTGEGDWLIRNRLVGDFPGGTVDLRYEFSVSDGRISRLVIAP